MLEFLNSIFLKKLEMSRSFMIFNKNARPLSRICKRFSTDSTSVPPSEKPPVDTDLLLKEKDEMITKLQVYF